MHRSKQQVATEWIFSGGGPSLSPGIARDDNDLKLVSLPVLCAHPSTQVYNRVKVSCLHFPNNKGLMCCYYFQTNNDVSSCCPIKTTVDSAWKRRFQCCIAKLSLTCRRLASIFWSEYYNMFQGLSGIFCFVKSICLLEELGKW